MKVQGTSIDRSAFLEAALSAARAAAAVVERVYATAFDVEYKGKNDPVTQADREANDMICRALESAYPGIPIVAEESDPSTFAGFEAEAACWFVDPLDGTREFVARNGEFAVMIGLAEEGTPTLGVVLMPALSRTFIAARGVGAFEVMPNGTRTPIHVSSDASILSARVVVSRSHRSSELDRVWKTLGAPPPTPCGSAGVKGVKVACGDADAYVHLGMAGKLWDTCAPEAIVHAAGGVLTDAAGRAIDYQSTKLVNAGGLIAAGAALHRELVATLQTKLATP